MNWVRLAHPATSLSTNPEETEQVQEAQIALAGSFSFTW